MMQTIKILFIGGLLLIISGCDKVVEKGVMQSDISKDVELVTDFGTIVMRLSDETPKHRNNFIKLVNEKFYDGIAFHRIIENFLIQTGDVETKVVEASEDFDASKFIYEIDAEIRSNLLHKRGAINAARLGDDQNPNRSSSGTQFTIIQGKVYNDSLLDLSENRINTWLAFNKVINKPENSNAFKKYFKIATKLEDIYNNTDKNHTNRETIKVLEDSLLVFKSTFDSLAVIELASMKAYKYPESYRKIYKTIGGAAHLDQNYTVFGNVVKGMDIVDSIAAVKTNKQDKPINEVRIISAKMIKRKTYN